MPEIKTYFKGVPFYDVFLRRNRDSLSFQVEMTAKSRISTQVIHNVTAVRFKDPNPGQLEEKLGKHWIYIGDADVPGKTLDRFSNSFDHGP